MYYGGTPEEKDKAFFGNLPTAIAPLQVITPPIARIPVSTFRDIANNDWERMSQYYAYSMFPFGRLLRDFSPAVDINLIDNPTFIIEKWLGMPAHKMERKVRKWKEGEKLRKPGPKPLWYTE